MSRRRRADWNITLRVLPLVALVVLAKLAVDLLGWDTVELTALHSGLVTGTVFLIGFLLAGTLADYKESEKLPGELAGRVETIADECEILYRDTGHDAARRCLAHLGEVARAIDAWLRSGVPVDEPLERIDELNHHFLAFQPLTQPNFIVRLKQEQSALRLLVFRINTIKETSFVGAGYRIAEISSILLVAAVIVADFAPLAAEMFLVGAITFVLACMILLIKDMDDPFEYAGRHKQGAVEVSLAPLDHLQRRMALELARLPESPPSAPAEPA